MTLKRASLHAPADEEEERDEDAELLRVCTPLQVCGERQHAGSPGVSEDGRRDAKGDNVCKGVKFPAEVTLGVCHACDASVECVEGDGEKDGDGCAIEVVGRGALQALGDGVKPSGDVNGREQRGQNEHAAAGTAARLTAARGFAECPTQPPLRDRDYRERSCGGDPNIFRSHTRQERNDSGPTLDLVALFHAEVGMRRQKDINA